MKERNSKYARKKRGREEEGREMREGKRKEKERPRKKKKKKGRGEKKNGVFVTADKVLEMFHSLQEMKSQSRAKLTK